MADTRLHRDWENAARCGDVPALREQLEAGSPVDALDRYGQSALMIAARGGHLEAVNELLRAGAALDITAKFGLSATMLAVINRHEDVARALADAGADLSLRGSGAPGFSRKTAADLARECELFALAERLTAAE